MDLSTFAFPTTIVFGSGAANRLPEELNKRGVRRALLVTDAGIERTPVFERVRKLAPEAAVFSKVDPNPTEQNVLDGTALYKESACDGVIALGGGSPLDAAKAIRLLATHHGPLADYDDLLDGSNRISSNLPPYIAIATTAGTGSEVGRSAVITIKATNRKTVIFSPHLIPSVALADPELTLDLPPHITAGTGMDAFTHNVEAFLAKGYHPMCDAIALAGTKLVWDHLPRVMANPHDLEARSNMLMAAMMGAVAFQKGLGAVHSLAHPLSTECGMHHGTTNAILLPVVLEYNRPAVPDRIRQLASLFGGGDAAERVRELNRAVSIKPRLRDWGVPESILPTLADKAVQDGCHQLNPRPCTREDLLHLYRQAY
ncbi:MAG TPA: iron-containing alcohol dehydrogenase [Bryobacteraceae bacterium]|nr:iron-containing alcohol dehydrogenase [Bryobacteraceae bacterium]